MCQKIVIDSQRKKDGRMYELKHRVCSYASHLNNSRECHHVLGISLVKHTNRVLLLTSHIHKTNNDT